MSDYKFLDNLRNFKVFQAICRDSPDLGHFMGSGRALKITKILIDFKELERF